jgi:hypothetical protein
MKNALALALILVACLLVASCCAENSTRFQSVGGDYGRKMISTIKTNETQTTAASNSNGTLWNWGSSPKGTLVVDGNLIGDPTYTMKRLNRVSNNYLGDTYVDPYGTAAPEYTYTDAATGEVVTTYVDPTTGESYYTYTDSVSKKLVYVYFNPETGVPTRTALAPASSQTAEKEEEQKTFSLPPIFS